MVINTVVSIRERNSEKRPTRVYYREIWQIQTRISLPNITGFVGEEEIKEHKKKTQTKKALAQ